MAVERRTLTSESEAWPVRVTDSARGILARDTGGICGDPAWDTGWVCALPARPLYRLSPLALA
eukprot:5377732-Amphidinium_carterae.1